MLKFLRFVKFAKIIRLVRALKLKIIIRKIEGTGINFISWKESFHLGNTLNVLISLLKLSLLILCLAHWEACLFYMVAISENEEDTNWMVLYGI